MAGLAGAAVLSDRRLAISATVALSALIALTTFASEHATSKVALVFAAIAFAAFRLWPGGARAVVAGGWVAATMLVVPAAHLAYENNLHTASWLPISSRLGSYCGNIPPTRWKKRRSSALALLRRESWTSKTGTRPKHVRSCFPNAYWATCPQYLSADLVRAWFCWCAAALGNRARGGFLDYPFAGKNRRVYCKRFRVFRRNWGVRMGHVAVLAYGNLLHGSSLRCPVCCTCHGDHETRSTVMSE